MQMHRSDECGEIVGGVGWVVSPILAPVLLSSHLHLQHLVENGLGQAFSDVSLVLSLGQPVSVLLVWDNASTPGDLQASVVSSAA